VSSTAEFLLGIIAVSVLVMATIQVAALVAGLRLARRLDALTRQLEQDVRPLLTHLATLTAEATGAARLATRQVERVDRLFAEWAQRVDQTLEAAQHAVRGPVRDGMAILAGVQAALSALQGIREASRRRRTPARHPVEDEESLFIG
jgi:hypothetical protein